MAVPALEVDGVRKSYGRRRAVDDMTFDIRAGELFGFVGSNGGRQDHHDADRPRSPHARRGRGPVWLGRPVGFADRRRFGYMPEERGLYPRMKVAEQLRYLGELHGLSPGASVDGRGPVDRAA
ncbi:hypothetical protein LV779_02125 [Streptomyces thinghirensis]|nr:hypothetical protein [Streptomyces thinghirensis]